MDLVWRRGSKGLQRSRFAALRVRPAGIHSVDPQLACHPLGKLPGSVWTIASEPLRLPPWIDTAHYAAFPSEWPRRLILGWSPPAVCLECGQGRFPVVERGGFEQAGHGGSYAATRRIPGEGRHPLSRHGEAASTLRLRRDATIVGYACACTPYTDHPERREPSATPRASGSLQHRALATGEQHAWPVRQPVREYHLDRWPPPARPAVVLDPFGGTGTTAHVAHALGRIGISLDLSEAYCHVATDRTVAGQRAAKVQGRVNEERQLELPGGLRDER